MHANALAVPIDHQSILFVATRLGRTQDGLTEQQKSLVVLADRGELVSLEPSASGDLRVLVPEEDLHLGERVDHDVPYLRVGEDRLHAFLVVVDPTEYPRRPRVAGGLRHEVAEVVEEALFAGAQGLRRAERAIELVLHPRARTKMDTRLTPWEKVLRVTDFFILAPPTLRRRVFTLKFLFARRGHLD